MTEFGSDRFLEKLNQSQTNGSSTATTTAGLSQSQFILPIRGSGVLEPAGGQVKPGDQKRSEKRGFGFLRNKFHVKSSSAATTTSLEHSEQVDSFPEPSTTKQR